MVTSTNPSTALVSAVQDTHTRLAELLSAARAMGVPRGTPRAGHERIDAFLATACRHLHAVDAVLLPAARRALPDGSTLVHDQVRAVRHLEVQLAHVKAHEYGSVYESPFPWSQVWADVAAAMEQHRLLEEELCRRLAEAVGADRVEELARALAAAEPSAPTRPHPYTPHTGLAGLVARRVMCTADRVWDAVEGRMVPEAARQPKRTPGRVAQYFLGDPRF